MSNNDKSVYYDILSQGVMIQNYIATDSSILLLPKNDDILVGEDSSLNKPNINGGSIYQMFQL
ncbi:MAG: hypothetical protein QW478_00110 [Candidatus Micrarchaeaceae archaeon]